MSVVPGIAALTRRVVVVAVLLWAAPATGQTPRLLDPLADGFVYDLAAAVSLRAGVEPAFASAKPWTSRDLGRLLAAVDSAGRPGTRGTDGREPPRWLVRALGSEVRTSAVDVAGFAGVVDLEHQISVEPRVVATFAAGEHETDPGFLSIRPREAEGDPAGAVGGELRLGYAWITGGLSLHTHLRGLSNTRNDFSYHDRDPGGTVDVRTAYALWENDRVALAAGRLPLEWGNGPLGGIGLAAHGPALDGMFARVRWGPAQVTILNAFLADERANRLLTPAGNTIESSVRPPGPAPSVDRYFHGHRLDLHLGERLSVGLVEAAVVSGVGRRADLQFMSGLVPYVVLQNSREEIDGSDINLGGGFQYRWRPSDGLLLYGEYFANEVFVDVDLEEVVRGLLGKRTNVQGFHQGLRWADPFGIEGVDIEAEVARLEPFLFLHRGLNTNWRQRGVPLGASLGPDNHRALARVRLYRPLAGGLLRGTAEIGWRERGIGRITDDTDIQGSGPPASIPREPVETWWSGALGAELWWARRGGLGMRLDVARVDDVDHVVGKELTAVDAEFYLKLGPAWDDVF